MKKICSIPITSTLLIAILSGCTTFQTHDKDTAQYRPAQRIIEKAPTAPEMQMNYHFSYGSNPALKKAFQTYLNTGKAPNITTEGFEQFAYGTDRQPLIAASPFELTVVSLEPGETITNVSSGDPARWSYSLAYSGQGAQKQPHVMIKPSQAGISTDFLLTTDKRYYTLKLVSSANGKYVRDVRFWYPQEMQDYWEKYNAQQANTIAKTEIDGDAPNLSVKNLNFNYSLSTNGLFTSAPAWQPLRTFDDGAHTYIQFPSSVSSNDLPVLYVLNGNAQELVNYRAKSPYFVVDKVFSKAVLVSGVGSQQTKVVITNHNLA